MPRTRKLPQDGPHPVDIHVGRQVALKRLGLGYSQTDLAQALGLTFQQVQKYEKGANRISSSKLWEIAGFLKIDIGSLFPDPNGEAVGVAEATAAFDHGRAATRHTIEIERLTPRLSPERQKLICEIIADMAGNGDSDL